MTEADRRDAPSAGRRLAAAVALLALVAAIVISAEAFLRDPVRLVVALVLVVLAVMAGWTALVRRGTWRLVASGVALVALVAVVVLIAAGSLVRTVVLIGLVLMSTRPPGWPSGTTWPRRPPISVGSGVPGMACW